MYVCMCFKDLVTIAKRQHDVKPTKIRKGRGGDNCCDLKRILDTCKHPFFACCSLIVRYFLVLDKERVTASGQRQRLFFTRDVRNVHCAVVYGNLVVVVVVVQIVVN